MLHITYGSSGTFYVTTEEKRIDTSVPSAQILLLFKFTNDLDKGVVYAYGQNTTHRDTINTYQRNTTVAIHHNTTENVFLGRVNFKPYGYWKYEIYEVSFNGTVPTLDADTAPITETDVADSTGSVHGTVKGKVEEGKLYVSETDAQVTYTQYTETSGTNYIYTN